MEEAFSKHITRKKFTRFVVPSVIMELVLGVYYLIDTLFVSIFVEKNALAIRNMSTEMNIYAFLFPLLSKLYSDRKSVV